MILNRNWRLQSTYHLGLWSLRRFRTDFGSKPISTLGFRMHKIPTEQIFIGFQTQTNFTQGDHPSEPLRVRDEGGPSRELDSSWIRNKRSIYFHSSVTLRARFQTYCIQFTLYARSLGSTARQSSSSSNLTQAAPELFLRGNASLIQKNFSKLNFL